jgi:hypothetical protein
MAFGVDSDAGGLAQVEVGGEFEEVRDGVKGDFGDRLSVGSTRNGYQQEQREGEDEAFHSNTPSAGLLTALCER